MQAEAQGGSGSRSAQQGSQWYPRRQSNHGRGASSINASEATSNCVNGWVQLQCSKTDMHWRARENEFRASCPYSAVWCGFFLFCTLNSDLIEWCTDLCGFAVALHRSLQETEVEASRRSKKLIWWLMNWWGLGWWGIPPWVLESWWWVIWHPDQICSCETQIRALEDVVYVPENTFDDGNCERLMMDHQSIAFRVNCCNNSRNYLMCSEIEYNVGERGG